MAQQTIGEIRLFAGKYPPKDWAFCQGQLVPISANQALFSVIGTTFGGDGRSTFALPDLRGKAVMAAGHGPGLSRRLLGNAQIGVETVSLTTDNMPKHHHTVDTSDVSAAMLVNDDPPNSTSPINNYLTTQSNNFYATKSNQGQYLQEAEVKYEVVIESIGASSPVNIMGPSQALNYIIAIRGQYPVKDNS